MINNVFRIKVHEETAFNHGYVIKSVAQPLIVWNICGIRVNYDSKTSISTFGEESYEMGKEIQDISFLVDDVIFEVSANYGIILGVYGLPEAKIVIVVNPEQFELLKVYQID